MKDLNYYIKLNYPSTMVKDEEGSYLIEYPDLKGCMSCAPTLNGAIEMAEDAKIAWIETAYDSNMDIPEPRELSAFSGNFKLRIPKTLHKNLVYTAKKEGISMNQLCVYLLTRELESFSKSK